MTTPPPGVPWSKAVEQGWREYHAYIENTRSRLLARPELQNRQMQAMANYAISSLIAGGFQFYLAPRQDCPLFYSDAVWSPIIPWGGPASDMVYRWCFLDGRYEYRITGKRGTTLFTDMHLFENYIGAEQMRNLGNYDLDAFETDSDGNFAIIASAREHPGNWMKLDESVTNIAIQVRETWWDWEAEVGNTYHVERIDDGPRKMLWSEEEFLQRLHLAGRAVEQFILRSLGYHKMVRTMAGGANRFSMVEGAEAANRDFGASPRAGYGSVYFSLAEDEALIIDSEMPHARYWSLQNTSPFWDTLDFNWHQSGLNGHQASIDSDGRVRFVIAHTDPGVANWLDTLGLPEGQCQYRWYDGKAFAPPEVTLVKAAEIAAHLPRDTKRVSSQERANAMRDRSRASLKRWHY